MAETTTSEVTPQERRKALVLGSLGGGLEFYDFVIYAVFAETLGQVFFPSDDPAARLIAVFGVFAMGYLMRPIGGVLFSHFGDRHGRRAMLRLSIAGMAGATILMALLPGYASLGIAATVAFVILRMVQGLCLGGEIPGAMVMITETMPERRGFACGTLFLMINTGLLLAQAVHWGIIHTMPESAVPEYGWRAGFLIGGLIAFVGYLLRAQLSESPAFEEMEGQGHKVPLMALLSSHGWNVAAGFFITGLGAVTVSMLYLYMDSYLNEFLKYPASLVATAGLLGTVLFSLPMPLAGWIADRTGLRWPALAGAVALTVAAIPIYSWIISGQGGLIPAMVIISIIAAFAWGIGPGVLTAIFPTDVRYSGVALVYNLGFALIGGLTPLIATSLIQSTGSFLPPAILLAVFAGLGAIATFFVRFAED